MNIIFFLTRGIGGGGGGGHRLTATAMFISLFYRDLLLGVSRLRFVYTRRSRVNVMIIGDDITTKKLYRGRKKRNKKATEKMAWNLFRLIKVEDTRDGNRHKRRGQTQEKGTDTREGDRYKKNKTLANGCIANLVLCPVNEYSYHLGSTITS